MAHGIQSLCNRLKSITQCSIVVALTQRERRVSPSHVVASVNITVPCGLNWVIYILACAESIQLAYGRKNSIFMAPPLFSANYLAVYGLHVQVHTLGHEDDHDVQHSSSFECNYITMDKYVLTVENCMECSVQGFPPNVTNVPLSVAVR